MRKIKAIITVVGCLGLRALAGDTNFVAAFNASWMTHNASNILVFSEQAVATNASPETLFARGSIAVAIQGWTEGATNYWAQSIQMIATNTVYSEKGRTNIIQEIQSLQRFISNFPSDPQPSWNTKRHAALFAETGDEVLFFDTLQNISTTE